MEKINTEIVISSLFLTGFDRVDPVFFVLVLGKIMIDNDYETFCFEEGTFSKTFELFTEYNGVIYKLKDGLSIDTNLGYKTLGKTLNTNKKLVDYLNSLDFNDIVLKKIDIYEITGIDDEKLDLFSDKEITILKRIFQEDTIDSKQQKLV